MPHTCASRWIPVRSYRGVVTILAAGKEKKVIGTVALDGAINSSAIAANGTLYIGTDKMLFAFKKK